MPNWCENSLIIEGDDNQLKEFRKAVVATYEQRQHYLEPDLPDDVLEELRRLDKKEGSILCFHRLVPVPEEILAKKYDDGGYHWELANWGCKWGACRPAVMEESQGYLVYTFDTPWTPPLKWLCTVAKQYPKFRFRLTCEEPGMKMQGTAEWRKGEIHEPGWTGYPATLLVDDESPVEDEG